MQKQSLALVWLFFAGALTGCAGSRAVISRRTEKTAANQTEREQVETTCSLLPDPDSEGQDFETTQFGRPSRQPVNLASDAQNIDSGSTRRASSGSDISLTSIQTDSGNPFPPASTGNTLLYFEPPDLMRLPPVDRKDGAALDAVAYQWSLVRADHGEFYSGPGLLSLGIGVGLGALMANTPFDESFLHDAYSENVILAPTHEFYERLHQPKILGDGRYTIPAFIVAALSEPILGDGPYAQATAEWGNRSLRTMLLGGPPMLGLQYLTGGSRPGEDPSQSKWQPLQDNNGVSGHSFMGAIPFLSAAKMTDNVWLKAGCYTASTLPALSRINDDDHYPSQAFLGWWLAYVAASAVDRSQAATAHNRIHVLPQPGGIGVTIEY